MMETGPGPGSGVVTSMNWVTLFECGDPYLGVPGRRDEELPPQSKAHSTPGKGATEQQRQKGRQRMNKGERASRKWRDDIKDSGK